jgi:hypothetical protein
LLPVGLSCRNDADHLRAVLILPDNVCDQEQEAAARHAKRSPPPLGIFDAVLNRQGERIGKHLDMPGFYYINVVTIMVFYSVAKDGGFCNDFVKLLWSPTTHGFARGKVDAPMKVQQQKIEDLTGRVIRLEAQLELLAGAAMIKKLKGN